jgi:hypothetical protein
MWVLVGPKQNHLNLGTAQAVRRFPARAFDLPLRLFSLRIAHLRQRFSEFPAGAAQNGNLYLQVAIQCRRPVPQMSAAASDWWPSVWEM